MHILFSPPDISSAEVEEVIEVIQSGWITTGPKTKEFERQIAEYVGVNKAVCLNSQTACAEMALRLLGIGRNDEVIVPSYTYTASASVIYHVGARIVFVDVQKNNLQMDYDALESAINKNTKAIIPVDLGGVPCDYKRIFEIVEKKKSLFTPSNKLQKAIGRVAVCADAAHAFGASWKGKKIGAVADFTSFSFHAVKNLTTAEGGALTWRSIEGIDDEELYQLIQLYSLHGQSKDALAKTQIGAWEYDIIAPWYKCNMTDIMAAIGIKQLERYKILLQRRKEIIEVYDNFCDKLGIKHIHHFSPVQYSCGHLYLTHIPGIHDRQRREIIRVMAEKGIMCNVHYKPLPMMTAYHLLGETIENYPNSYALYENEISLPLHTLLRDEEIEYLLGCLKEAVKPYFTKNNRH